MKEINQDYVKQYVKSKFGEDLPEKNMNNILSVMERYGNNYWWESKDIIEIAMYQVFERILMVPFGEFHGGLEKLLDRPVWTHEFGLNIEGIREEARSAIARYKLGNGGISDEKRQEKIQSSIQMLEDYCKKTGKQLLKVDLSQEEDDKNEDGLDMSGYDGEIY